MRWSRSIVVVGLSAVLFSTGAAAQEADPVPDAAEVFAQGLRAWQSGDRPSACAAFARVLTFGDDGAYAPSARSMLAGCVAEQPALTPAVPAHGQVIDQPSVSGGSDVARVSLVMYSGVYTTGLAALIWATIDGRSLGKSWAYVAIGGTTLGMLTGWLATRHREVTGGQALSIVGVSSLAAADAALVAGALGAEQEDVTRFAALGSIAGLAAGILASGQLRPTVGSAATAESFALFGMAEGAMFAYGGGGDSAIYAALGSGAGLGLGVLTATATDMTPTRVLIIDGAALGSGLVGGLLFYDEHDLRKTAVGSAAFLLAGGVISFFTTTGMHDSRRLRAAASLVPVPLLGSATIGIGFAGTL